MTEEELNVLMREPQNEGEYLGATLRLLIEHREDKYNEYVKKYARRFGDYECLELVEREEEVHKLLHKNPDELTGQEIKWLKGLHEDSGIDVEDFLTQKELRQFYQIIGLGPQIEEPEQPHIQEPASNKQQLVVKQQTPVEPKKESVMESKYIPSVNMQTTPKIINALQSLLNTMFKRAKEGNTDCVLTEDMLGEFRNMAVENPALFPFCLNDLPSSQEVASFFGNVEKHARASFTMPYMPISYFKDNIQGKDVYTPAFLPWQTKDNNIKNFIINYDNATAERAVELYKHMVMSILLGLPAKSVHLSFVNVHFSDWTNFFTAEDALDKTIYEKITSNSEYHQLLERLRKRIREYKYGPSLEVVNESVGKIEDTYEIVVLIDDPEAEMQYQDELVRYFENGSKFGIYFIGLNNTEKVAKRDDQDNILKHTDSYYSINAEDVNSWRQPQKNGFITATSIANNSFWSRAAFDYLKEIVNRKVVHKFDWDTAIKTPYTPTDNEIAAPIGFTEEGTPFNFKMDDSHVHAFIIGDTGSGKSRFLHNLILSMTAKYQPEDVELYLLDFKGIEFPCYKGFKHARTIVVDYSDDRIVYEVLRNIQERIEERRQLFAGVSKISEYNKLHPDNRQSQIIILVDECQMIFPKRPSKLQRELADIIALIAQQGRAFGIHIILATQSLANADIDPNILSQIREHYILLCNVKEAGRLLDQEKQMAAEKAIIAMQGKKGQCFYQGADGEVPFTFNFVSEGEMQQTLIEQITKKASAHHAFAEQKYFSGSLQYPIDQEVVTYMASLGGKNIITSPGRRISMDQTPFTISLKDEMSENVVLFGINDKHFATRTALDVVISLMISNKQKNLGYRFVLLDCLGDEEAEYHDTIDVLCEEHMIEVVSSGNRIEKLKQLCDSISSKHTTPTILIILGQEKFVELVSNKPLEDESKEMTSQIANEELPPGGSNAAAATLAAINSINFITQGIAANYSLPSSLKTTKDALNYILDKGPACGIHSVIQVSRPVDFMCSQGYNKDNIYKKCKHIIFMRSEASTLNNLMLKDDIDMEISKFIDKPDHLRAYYYNSINDNYQLFTPYILPDKKIINNIY